MIGCRKDWRRFFGRWLIAVGLVLLLFVTACDDAAATDAIEATLAALSSQSAQQAAEISAQATTVAGTAAALMTENEAQAAEIAVQATAVGTVAALAAENEALAATMAAQATAVGTVAAQGTFISHVATRGPFVATPVPPGAEPTPYRPVVGSVTIEGGRCCAGGRAGDVIELAVEFEASSPVAEVTEMRVRVANVTFTEEDLAEAEWEPFVNRKSVPVNVALNWVGYFVTVQYRDAAGNLSPVYSDDIAVEGSP
ncbi:MAG TPA: hypothetical protein VF177_03105 [Anaerolineae bacterium]